MSDRTNSSIAICNLVRSISSSRVHYREPT
jgi:hypothetical protein